MLADWDVTERLVEALAPELLPMLLGTDPSSDGLPLTNTLLAELQRRGVSRDTLLQCLQDLGQEVSFLGDADLKGGCVTHGMLGGERGACE